MIDNTPTNATAAPPPPEKCANIQCSHWSRKGCTLFPGIAWRACRNARNGKLKTKGSTHDR